MAVPVETPVQKQKTEAVSKVAMLRGVLPVVLPVDHFLPVVLPVERAGPGLHKSFLSLISLDV